jgi:hypothetical protein
LGCDNSRGRGSDDERTSLLLSDLHSAYITSRGVDEGVDAPFNDLLRILSQSIQRVFNPVGLLHDAHVLIVCLCMLPMWYIGWYIIMV